MILLLMTLAASAAWAQGTAGITVVNLSDNDSTRIFSIDQGSHRTVLGLAAARQAGINNIAFQLQPKVYDIAVRDSATGRVLATKTTALMQGRNYVVYTGSHIVIWSVQNDRFALFSQRHTPIRFRLATGELHTPMVGGDDPLRPWGPSSDFDGLVTISAGIENHYGAVREGYPILITTAKDGTAGVFSLGDSPGALTWPLVRWSTDSSAAPLRLRVVNASRTATSVDLEYGAGTDRIEGVGSMTASRSYRIEPGMLTWRVRINGGEWREAQSTLLRSGSIYTVLVVRAPSDSGEVATIYDCSASRLMDSISGWWSLPVLPAKVRVTLLPRSPATYWGEVVSKSGGVGTSFQIRQQEWPDQYFAGADVDTGTTFIDIHGDLGTPMLDRIAFDGVRAGDRHRILLESRPDSTFDAWRYNELDTAAQSLAIGEHMDVSSVEGKVRLVNMSSSNFIATIEPGSDTLDAVFQTIGPWINTNGERLVLSDRSNGEEFLDQTFERVRKGITTFVVYDTGSSAPAVLSLRAYPLAASGMPSLRVAAAIAGPDTVTLQVYRGVAAAVRFDTVAAGRVTPFKTTHSYGWPDEFRVELVDPDNRGRVQMAMFSLPSSSFTTLIVTTGPILAGKRSRGGSSGRNYIWALREFPDDSTTSALTLLDTPAGIGEEFVIERAEIWPNPSRGTLSIRLEPGRALKGHLVATDILGRVVADFGERHLPAAGTTIEVDLSGVVAGVYTLSIQESSGRRVYIGEVIRR